MDGRRNLGMFVQGCCGALGVLRASFRRPHRPLTLLLASGIFLTLEACADPDGIQAFGKMAPEPSIIQGLIKVYAQELDAREDIKLLGDSPPNPEIAKRDLLRAQQA